MKFLVLITALVLSLNVVAQENKGYICVAKNKTEAAKLKKIASKLGDDYLPFVGVLIVRPETCAEAFAMIYRDVCAAGPYTVTLGLKQDGALKLSANMSIKLLCDENLDVGGHPSMGGTN